MQCESISMMFFIIRKATHLCKFIIMINSILPTLGMKTSSQNILIFILARVELVRFYCRKFIKGMIDLYFYDIWYWLKLGAELHMLVGTYLISLMQTIKDESKKTKDINSLLRNNRRNQQRSKRKNNFHTIA